MARFADVRAGAYMILTPTRELFPLGADTGNRSWSPDTSLPSAVGVNVKIEDEDD
jgi:hypothetical protein